MTQHTQTGGGALRPPVGLPARLGALVLSVAVGAAVPAFLRIVSAAGWQIPQPRIEADYVTGVVWAAVLGLGILAWPVSRRDRGALFGVWVVKCFVTLGFMLFYEYSYGLDAYKYFLLSKAGEVPWGEVGIGRGTENILALCWFHHQVIPASYHAVKVSFAMAGLVAVYVFYRGAVIFLGREDLRLFYFIALFPSVLFWSSILGKDPVVLLGISVYAYGVIGWIRLRRARFLAYVVLGVLIAMLIRLWMGPILLLPLGVAAMRGLRSPGARILFVAGAVFAFYVAARLVINRFSLLSPEALLMGSLAVSRNLAEGGSGEGSALEITSVGGLLAFIPFGAFTALFRPLLGEVMNPFGILAGTEGVFLVALLLRALIRARWDTLREPLVVWALLVVAAWAGVYSLISPFNLGGAVRFKLQILPMLLGLLLYLSQTHARRVVLNAHGQSAPPLRTREA